MTTHTKPKTKPNGWEELRTGFNRVGLDGKRTENNLISLDQAISAITNNKQDERQSNSKGR